MIWRLVLGLGLVVRHLGVPELPDDVIGRPPPMLVISQMLPSLRNVGSLLEYRSAENIAVECH